MCIKYLVPNFFIYNRIFVSFWVLHASLKGRGEESTTDRKQIEFFREHGGILLAEFYGYSVGTIKRIWYVLVIHEIAQESDFDVCSKAMKTYWRSKYSWVESRLEHCSSEGGGGELVLGLAFQLTNNRVDGRPSCFLTNSTWESNE
jgi:hypothetical protein